ncbi:OmpA family protein [Gilvimarinus sp. DA14]|uniref:OmpA family protein n=1 Tax=Gilvimarinus sp. DA14 TaxID=2956798 RepID=UPI0020B6A84C|nr:OmpA family protein [Gilvimarinus sp. DA14]UTF59913.1 OmpA family protein [Gilvimarinus sp. DA14]
MISKSKYLGVSLCVSVMALSACSSTDTAQTSEQDSSYELVNMRTEKDVQNVNAAQSGYHAVKVADDEAPQSTDSARDETVSTEPEMEMEATEEVLPVAKTVRFEFDSDELTPRAKTELLTLLDSAEDAEGVKIQAAVDGYADATGPSSYNQELSKRRAQSVAEYLEYQGAEVVEWQVQGHGESNPVADNSDASGRQQNRRVEVNLVSLTDRELQDRDKSREQFSAR